MTLGLGDVLTCLLANLCSQLGLQLPRPQLVLPSSSPILLPGQFVSMICFAREVIPHIRWSSEPFCVQCQYNCHCSPLSAQTHNSFSCCTSPPTVTNSMIWWHNLTQLSLLLDLFTCPIPSLSLHWWLEKLWRFCSFPSWFHSALTFSE